jgi:ubiquinone biosynthesis monooxygenase Coq7
MMRQEVVHLANLQKALPQRRTRPSVLLPLWDLAGYALGYGTALMGPKAAMACTVAVETVITEHYNDQLRTLNGPDYKDEGELKAMIKSHRDDEEVCVCVCV